MKLRSDYRAAVMMKNRLHHESGEPIEEPIQSIQVNKDAYDKDKKFSLKNTCRALELTNIQDGNIGLHLQVPRGGTHPYGVGSELTKIFVARISFLFRFQLTAIYCYRRRWCEQNTLTPHIFPHICTHFIHVHMHRMAQGVAARVL